MALIGSAILFAIFAVNVALGSFSGSAFLSDVGEMLVLAATSILFVVAILKREAEEKDRAGKDRP